MDSSLFAVLDVLIEQRSEIDKKISDTISQIRRSSERGTTSAPAAASTRTQRPARKKRRLSAAGRKAISDALRRRHAANKAAQKSASKRPAKKAAAKTAPSA
jgi:hypothetical protein